MIDRFKRTQRLQEKMLAQKVEGFLVTQNVDLYYFTGTMQNGFLFIPGEGEPVFYVRKSLQRAEEESRVKVQPLGSLRSFGATLSEQFPQVFSGGKKPVIATEYDVLPVQVFQRLEGAIPGVVWTDGSTLVRETRMIKSPDEIATIKEAARVINNAFEKAVSHMHEGMMEFHLVGMIEQSIRMDGHLGIMRMRGYNQELVTGMVAAGVSAATPTYFDGPAGGLGLSPASPQSSSRNPILRNQPVLIDIGCNIEGYVIDQTRTAVIGELPDDLAGAYEVSEQILRATEAKLRPGTICEELYVNALEQAREAGLSDHFMGYGTDQVKFLGHGIGLEIDELPVLAKGFKFPLQKGMVIAIEPKFTFPGRGVVGIENSYAITDDGFEMLTVSREGIVRKD
jgi:Xaa-Pro dipeptidase